MADESLDSLAALFRRAGSEAITRQVEAVVKKAAVNIKKDWRENAKASVGNKAGAYPFSITFDGPTRNGHTVEAEIGPDKDKKQGALGNLIEYGAPAQNTAPHNDGKRAADKELPNFERNLANAAASILSTDYLSSLGGQR